MPEIIIIGAGVVGASIAYHLAKQGCQDVTVLEKNYVGSGSTEKCAGGIRQQFSTEINIKLSMESVKFFERFEEETGHTADFRQHGYLLLATSERELAAFHQNVAVQRKLGLEVQLISPQEVAELVPGLNVEDILGATFCPTDGYADPYSVVSGFASAAKRLGVGILEETEVTGIELIGDKVKGVLTTRGKFEASVAVNAAGPYAGVVGKMAGLDIPVQPSRRHLFITEPLFRHRQHFDGFNRSNLPMVVDFHNGFWFRREGSCLIFGMRNPDEPQGFSTSVDWEYFSDVLAPAASQRLPRLKDIGIMKGQAGLHSDTPDCMAILGEGSTIDGLYLACGFSGHGFMHSPAVGRLIADLILGEKTLSLAAYSLALDRFHHQVQQKESAYI
ncbi:MAG: NAD(P)/FAD-dependent oxidoreductase [Dehalococcoidales bacterium]